MVSVWIHLRVNCHGISGKRLDEIHHGWTIHETENPYLGGMLRHYGRRHDDADHRRSGCMSARPVFGNGGKPLPTCPKGTYAMNWDQRVAPSALQGHYSINGTLRDISACKTLQGASYSARQGAASCTSCPAGTYARRRQRVNASQAVSSGRRWTLPAHPVSGQGHRHSAGSSCTLPAGKYSAAHKGDLHTCPEAYMKAGRPAKPAVRASIPPLIDKAARNALRERTLRRGEPAILPCRQVLCGGSSPPAPPAQAAREAFPAAAPA